MKYGFPSSNEPLFSYMCEVTLWFHTLECKICGVFYGKYYNLTSICGTFYANVKLSNYYNKCHQKHHIFLIVMNDTTKFISRL
jgi:hypothetical protein